MRGRSPRWRWLVAISGVLLAVIAVVIAFAWGDLFDYLISRQMVLSNTSVSYPDWLAPALPLYFDVYLFNWTNADRFPGEVPQLVQLGPYRYREYRRHVNVSFYPQNGSVAYRTQRTWYYEEDSPGRLDDVITSIDMLTASAIFSKRHDYSISQNLLAFTLAGTGHKISVTRTARELLFDGYDDSLLQMAKLVGGSNGGAPVYDKFGWFYMRNNSMDTEGHMMVTTGDISGSLPGTIIKWNHNDHLPFYDGECSKMVGSVGEFFPRNQTEDTKLTVFLGDLCRTVHMDYVGSGDVDGLKYLKYELTEKNFDNSSLTQENTCFCHGECLWGGVMNVSACRYGAPIFLSLPHFLHGDKKLHDLVHGLEPDPEKHSFYFGIEPKMGVPIDVAGRFQVNVYIEPSSHVALYANVPRMLFPVFWVEQHVVVNRTVTDGIKYGRKLHDWGGTVFACIAVFFSAIATLTVVTCYVKRPKYSAPADIIFEKTKEIKDEAEIKLNPM